MNQELTDSARRILMFSTQDARMVDVIAGLLDALDAAEARAERAERELGEKMDQAAVHYGGVIEALTLRAERAEVNARHWRATAQANAKAYYDAVARRP